MTAPLPEHSPLGASGASRWLKCPGSVTFSRGVADDESEHAALGTAAHTLGAICLTTDTDAWEHMGKWPGSDGHLYQEPDDPSCWFQADKEMVDAVQVYLNGVRSEHRERNQYNSFVERRFHCPSIHPLFFGTSDFCHVDAEDRTLHVWDYKHGAGIVIEVQENPQLMYYAVGVLEDLDLWRAVDKVVLHVAQPRGFHPMGPLRDWATTTEHLREWLEDVLIPGMKRAEVSRETASGDHCRFCPARLRECPQLLADMEELEELIAMVEKKEGGVAALSNEQVARILNLNETMKIWGKAARETGFQRVQKGGTIPGWKLVAGRKNREFREGAEAAAVKKFGKKRAFTTPELKSPAAIEALPGGKDFTSEWAYKPIGGNQLVPAGDARTSAGPDVKKMFKPQTGKKSRSKK